MAEDRSGPQVSPGSDLILGDDGRWRCGWVGPSSDYQAYHDHEWGRPVRGEAALFERITLEGFQSGLSWLTILRKRAGFRAAFAGFEPAAVAAFDQHDVRRLLADAAIVRNRQKIQAAIANAQAVLALRQHGGLEELVWSFAPAPSPAPRSLAEVPASTPTSVALSKALKKAGLSFVGPVTAYAAMQACGLVDDHLDTCHASRRSAHG